MQHNNVRILLILLFFLWIALIIIHLFPLFWNIVLVYWYIFFIYPCQQQIKNYLFWSCALCPIVFFIKIEGLVHGLFFACFRNNWTNWKISTLTWKNNCGFWLFFLQSAVQVLEERNQCLEEENNHLKVTQIPLLLNDYNHLKMAYLNY